MRDVAAHNRFIVGRFLQALAIGKGEPTAAIPFAQSQGHWLDRSQVVEALKAAVTPMDTGGYPGAFAPVGDAVLAALRAYSIPRNLPKLRMVPMLTRIFVDSSGIVAIEVPEGGAIPVLRGNWTVTTLIPRKHGGIAVQTSEHVGSTDPVASAVIGDDAVQAVGEAEGKSFIDPTVAGSVLENAPHFAASGSDATAIRADLADLADNVRGARRGGVWTMTSTTATYIACTLEINELGPEGGRLLGLPVLTTEALEQGGSPVSRIVALLSPRDILFADGGVVELSTSKKAALKMDDAATADAGNLVSMFQSDSVALKAVLSSSWYPRPGCAAYYTCSY